MRATLPSVCPHDYRSQCALQLCVYNANPATILPNQELVLQGLRREDLFTVVHEQHLTDTTDYNSSFSQSERMRRRQRGPAVLLNPADAAAHGIRGGGPVLVRSARGEARFTAELAEDTRAGVVVVEGIWWSKHQPGGRGVNALTDALHSNLVQVERLAPRP